MVPSVKIRDGVKFLDYSFSRLDRANHYFSGWYLDEGLTQRFGLNITPVTEEIVNDDEISLYAKFSEVDYIENASATYEDNYHTVASLSFDYRIDSESNYSFSSMSIKFGSAISIDLFNSLDVIRYGVIVATNESLNNQSFGELTLDDPRIMNVYSDDVSNMFRSNADGTANVSGSYYLWKAMVEIPTNASYYFTKGLHAAAYIVNGKGEYVLLDDKATSVSGLAREYQSKDVYESLDNGAKSALDYLASL